MGWNGMSDSSWVIYCVDTFRTMPSCIASPPLLTMRPTNSALNNSVGAPLEAASFPLCAMCDANSSPSGLDWYILQSCIVFTPSHLRRASNRPLPSVLDWYIRQSCISLLSLPLSFYPVEIFWHLAVPPLSMYLSSFYSEEDY